jgi:hypothetical protein
MKSHLMHGARVGLFMLLITSGSLEAHGLHQSSAEAEYNSTTRKLEISLTVFVSDLELALVRQVEREISLSKTPAAELDTQIQRYLSKTFVVSDASGKPATLQWVGREIDVSTKASGDPTVTLYFEMPLPDGLQGTTLRHGVFCDLFKDQSNLLHLRSGAQSTELRFTHDEAKRSLVFAK